MGLTLGDLFCLLPIIDRDLLTPESSRHGQGLFQTYPAQAVIFHQDTSVHAVYLIEQGLVKSVRVVENKRKVIIDLHGNHWFIGAL
jgi:CRP-like cAMP-binding protein